MEDELRVVAARSTAATAKTDVGADKGDGNDKEVSSLLVPFDVTTYDLKPTYLEL